MEGIQYAKLDLLEFIFFSLYLEDVIFLVDSIIIHTSMHKFP